MYVYTFCRYIHSIYQFCFSVSVSIFVCRHPFLFFLFDSALFSISVPMRLACGSFGCSAQRRHAPFFSWHDVCSSHSCFITTRVTLRENPIHSPTCTH